LIREIVAAAVICCAGPGPSATVESESLSILGVLGAGKSPTRLERAWLHAERLLDIDEIAERALSPHWAELSADQRWDARRLMRGFMRRVLTTQLDKFRGEQIQFQKESIREEYATVTARLVSLGGSSAEVKFLAHYRGESWRVYDVQVSGVSMLSNYRAQFRALWKQGGWPAVKAALESKQ